MSHARSAAPLRVEAVDLAPHGHECVVHHVLCFLPIADDAECRGESLRRVGVVQLAERLRLAGANPMSQPSVDTAIVAHAGLGS